MPIDVTKLNQEQVSWYTSILINTVLADANVASSEVKYIKQVIKVIDDPDARDKLIRSLEDKKLTPLTQPKGLVKRQLGEILTELLEICISDLELERIEEEWAWKVAKVFDFHDMYTRECITWANEGLVAKRLQQTLISKTINDEEFIVPIKALNVEQKKWYVDVIVSTLINEGVKEQYEVDLLKKMLMSSESKDEQLQLRQHVLMKHRPPLKRPPKMPDELLVMIFMEVVQISIRLGEMGYTASQYLKVLADLSRMPTKTYTDVMDWCNRLVAWKQRKKNLLANVRLNTSDEDQEAESRGLLVTHPQCNSIQVRKVKCFICESTEEFSFFQIKANSHKLANNIFNVQAYKEANEGFDLFDYNKVRVCVCPHCYFASIKKGHFKLNDKEKTPKELDDRRFQEQWVGSIEKRAALLGEYRLEIKDIGRSNNTVLNTYELAIQASQELAAQWDSDQWRAQVINLKMHQAEILWGQGRNEEAQAKLQDALTEAERLFVKSKENTTAFRLGRLLLMGALYFTSSDKMGQYYEFFRTFKDERAKGLPNEEQAEFMRYFTEVGNIWDRRELYAKAELDGFHIKKFKRAKKEEE
ncbi:MAG: hypothetical protein A2527_08295 [Candidatus Lambdaproteobacteria bacterium RIFOXYD2_FULL_50_16]|uniref:DUF2225 domain-containing protein n=1 Tax=Candidatus Lambdaproteobacteria bacterium RIFOXYD2_FULL_50_16 TaxID=1817772 RepID=A0A1F6GAM3_9PROT|nr:MAG: hypothetical protein A2527_08295 [Candidatus Lambdaproteobacteria bacterium RIFOXYD2_FULL_50_16]